VKIAVIGGGSTYTPELVFGLAEQRDTLGLDTIALMDVDRERLEIVSGFVRRMVDRQGANVRIEATLDVDRAVEGARFVIAQIRVGGQAARLQDERLGKAFGVIGQETTGVGGLAKALRTIPVLFGYARILERRAKDAFLLNFTNPVSIVTEALLGAGARCIGLCNIPISQRMEIGRELGVDPSEVEIDSIGLNHLSFIRGVRVRGEEVLPRLIGDVSKLLRSGSKPANIPDLDFPPMLLESLGMIPSDYLRYFFLATETIEEQRAKAELRAEAVMAIEAELLACYRDPNQSERPPASSKRGGAFYSKAAIEIIEAVTADTGASLIVDVRNGSTVPELPPAACIEAPCAVGAGGARPLPQRPLDPPIRGLIQHVKAYEELAIRAALSRSRRDLYLALITHPLTPSAARAESIAAELAARLGW
jgi:6-phospho-beta-glucosidase